jgi:hypothetical protein
LLEAYAEDKRAFAIRTGRCAEGDPTWNEIFNNIYEADRDGSGRFQDALAGAKGAFESCLGERGAGAESSCRAEAGFTVTTIIAPGFSASGGAAAATPRQPEIRTPEPVRRASAGQSSLVAIPRYKGGKGTAGAFVIDLADGSGRFIDSVKLSPPSYRERPMDQNVLSALGRSPNESARPGEVLVGEIRATNGAVTGLLLVDTTTGVVAYLDEIVDEPHRAIVRNTDGRPAADLASFDGNYALLMRRDDSGATDGAYLYHATTGRCLYFAHVDDMEPVLEVEPASDLPVMEGRVAAITLQEASEATPEALLIDEASGTVYRVGAMERAPVQISVNRQNIDLFEVFPSSAQVTTPQRFVLVPGYADKGVTSAVFIIDAGTGRMAVLKNARQAGGMHLVPSDQVLPSHAAGFPTGAGTLAAVPKVGSKGTTDGAWVFGPAIDGVLVMENVRGPDNLEIHAVETALN